MTLVDLTSGETPRILSACSALGLDLAQTAYVLATAEWETAGAMTPVREACYLGARAETYRKTLRYYPWYGRGFAQLTWEANYARAGAALGLDLCADPDLALEAEAAAQILTRGMAEGWFTGRRLDRYVTLGSADYVSARRVVNGTDCAKEIAARADVWEAALTPASEAPVLRRGMAGAAVARLQAGLIAAGQTLTADGIFGRLTEAALRRFQSARGLAVDGVAGPAVWSEIIATEETRP